MRHSRTWRAVVLVDLEPSPELWKDRPSRGRDPGCPDEDHFLFFSKPEEIEQWVLPFLLAH